MTFCTTSQCGTGMGQITLPNDPDNNILLSATPVFGGVEVKWTLPATNPFAVAYVRLYRGISDNFAAAVLVANPSGDHYFDRWAWDQVVEVYYWIEVVSINGTVGQLIGPATTAARPTVEDIIEQLTGKITNGLLATELINEIGRIDLNASNLQTEIAERTAANNQLAITLGQMQSTLDEASTLISQEITNRQDGDSALVYQVNTIAAANAANMATLTQDYYTKVDADSAITSALTNYVTSTGLNDALGNYTTTANLQLDYYTKTDADSAISSAVSVVSSQVAKTVNYRITAKGMSATAGSNTLKNSAGTVIGTAARSYMVSVFNGTTGAHISSTNYDVYGSPTAATNMAAELNALDNTKVVVVSTYDEPKTNRLLNGLPAAMYRCGASSLIFGSANFKSRGAYILVGIPELGEGNGIERYAGSADNSASAYCEYVLQLYEGRPVGLGGNPLTAALKTDYYTKTDTDSAISSAITTSQTTMGTAISTAQTTVQTNINTVAGKVSEIGALYTVKVSVRNDGKNLVGGFGIYNDGTTVQAGFDVDTFWIGKTITADNTVIQAYPFMVDNGVVYIKKAMIADASITLAKIDTANITNLSSIKANMGTITAGKMQSTDGKFVIDLDNKYISITV